MYPDKKMMVMVFDLSLDDHWRRECESDWIRISCDAGVFDFQVNEEGQLRIRSAEGRPLHINPEYSNCITMKTDD